MTRIQEKIKDLVDVRQFEPVQNFATDAQATVTAYRFTDATAELMAKWLDEIAEIGMRGTGAARALAGNRGVGKSHFLAVLSALAAHPELRGEITDNYVAAGAQRLARSRYRVVNVERGLGANLIDELRSALDRAFNEQGAAFGETVEQLLASAAARNGALPLIVVVDSAYARKSRVKRDDGALLGEMATAVARQRIFLAIALDDDISGADGVNAAIARTCAIDFLDQEHLYRIVDAFLFPKRPSARVVLRDLYQNFRQNTPGFNWSEPRFAALYPIHPVVVDITPAVRLYAPHFALLPFIAENASKVLNRPAHSLLALDEVFERVEPELRKSNDLTETFAVYDELLNSAVAQIPIMQRLQAKLVLKGLLLSSLDGRGATARELVAALLLTDENQPQAAVQRVEDIIQLFINAVAPDKLRRHVEDNEHRYSLGNSATAMFEVELQKAAQTIESQQILNTLRRFGAARFPDWIFSDFIQNANHNQTETQFEWRGTLRRGRVFWQTTDRDARGASGDADEWRLLIAPPDSIQNSPNDQPTILWQSDNLRRDEEDAIRRYIALVTRPDLSRQFGDAAIAAEQSLATVIERIWTRVFLENGRLIVDGQTVALSTAAAQTETFGELLNRIFAPVFERMFPAHPSFARLLTNSEVSGLVSELFTNLNAASSAAQQNAETFAAPLGLTARRDDRWVLETDENLLKLPLVKIVLDQTNSSNGRGVNLRDIAAQLHNSPYGLTKDAQNLLLAALVARRRLEFVTATNDRLTHRSLDLQINWDDLTGVAQPLIQPRSSSELAKWASLLTETPDLIALDTQVDREKVETALRDWLARWTANSVLTEFAELPEEVVNVRAWRAAQHIERETAQAAEAVFKFLRAETTLEDCLEAVISAFAETPEAVAENQREIAELNCFVRTAKLRQTAWRYVARAVPFDNAEVERLRREILEELALSENAFDAQTSADFENLWREFHQLYQAEYLELHDRAMCETTRVQLLDRIEQSAEFIEFESLFALPVARRELLDTAIALRREIRRSVCTHDTAQILQTEAVCVCGFRRQTKDLNNNLLPQLTQIIGQGRAVVRRILTGLAAPLVQALNQFGETQKSVDEFDRLLTSRARELADGLRQNGQLPSPLTALDLRLLSDALERMPPAMVRVKIPRGLGALPSEKLRTRLNEWLDNLPGQPILVKLNEDDA